MLPDSPVEDGFFAVPDLRNVVHYLELCNFVFFVRFVYESTGLYLGLTFDTFVASVPRCSINGGIVTWTYDKFTFEYLILLTVLVDASWRFILTTVYFRRNVEIERNIIISDSKYLIFLNTQYFCCKWIY